MSKKDNRFWGVVILATVLMIIMFIFANSIAVASYKMNPPTGDPLKEPVVIRTTCYTADEGSVCSTGIPPHEGVVAACKEWEGMAVALYAFEYDESGEPVPTECIGLFTVLDTGAGIDTDYDGKGDSIRNGQSIDVYMPTLHAAEEFRDKYGDYTLMMLIPEGD